MGNRKIKECEIIDYYDGICLDKIDSMESVKQFKEDFNERVDAVSRFRANHNSIYKLLHPVKLIKNRSESKKLDKIYSAFSNLYYGSVIKFINEETGDLQEDLNNAANITKPSYVDTFVKSIKLKK